MNFEQVRQIAGQKDDKGYQSKLTMFGIVDSVGQIEFNQKTGAKCQKIGIRDISGEQQTVKIYLGNGPELTMNHVQQKLSFDVGPNPYQNKMYYAGFWNSSQQTYQGQSQIPPKPPQTPQTPPQAPKPPQGVQLTPKDYVAIRKDVVIADFGKEGNWLNVLDKKAIIDCVVDYIATGNVPPIPVEDPMGPNDNMGDFNWKSPALDDDIPI